MFHFRPKPRPPRWVGRVTPGQDVDSSAIDGDGRYTLEEVAGVLEEYPKTAVVIQGHTDSTGSEEHNQALSERRADSVYRYLMSQGVDGARMSAVGFGESEPVASNASESAPPDTAHEIAVPAGGKSQRSSSEAARGVRRRWGSTSERAIATGPGSRRWSAGSRGPRRPG